MFGYKSILDILKAFFINAFTLFMPYIPRAVSGCIAGLLGFLAFVLLKRRRRAIIAVLKVVRPEADNAALTKLACKTLINYANNFADFLRLYHMKAKELISITELEGFGHLEKALEEKKGAILVTAHLGNWEVGSNFIACLGFPFMVVAESAGPGDTFYKLFKRYRERFGTIIISLENPSIGFTLRQFLRRGYLIGLVGDRDIAGTSVEVNFFGKKAVFPQGPAFLSLLTRSPIVTGFFVRRMKKGRKFYFCYGEETIDFKGGKDTKENIRNLTQIIANRIERAVKKFPDQWFSFPPPWEHEKGSKQKTDN